MPVICDWLPDPRRRLAYIHRVLTVLCGLGSLCSWWALFDALCRYSIERPNKSVALIVMNIRTVRPDRFAGPTSTPEALHTWALWEPWCSIERVCCVVRRAQAEEERVSVCMPSSKTHQRASICNASVSHRPTTLNACTAHRAAKRLISH